MTLLRAVAAAAVAEAVAAGSAAVACMREVFTAAAAAVISQDGRVTPSRDVPADRSLVIPVAPVVPSPACPAADTIPGAAQPGAQPRSVRRQRAPMARMATTTTTTAVATTTTAIGCAPISTGISIEIG